MMSGKRGALILGLLLACAPAAARDNGTKPAAPPAAAVARSAPARAALRKPGTASATAVAKGIHVAAVPAAYAAIPESRRRAIQADLALLDDFDAGDTKNRDALTFAAIKAFQQRHGGKDTGILSDDEFAALNAAVKTRQDALGWRVFDDTATGARVGLPLKLLPQTAAARIGSRWSSAQGQVQVETFALHEASLPALFDQERKGQRHRTIDASELGADSFVISGTQGLKDFIVRAEASGSQVRGITVLYDQATAGSMASVALAVADTFEGFPDPDLGPPPGVKRSVDYGTAIVATSRGHLIASARVTDECQTITIAGLGHAERIAIDKADDLALLRLYGAQNLVPAALGAPGGSADHVTLVGVADPLRQAGGDEVSRVPVQASGRSIDPAPQLGFAGAAAIDAQGQVVGMVDLALPLVAGGNGGGGHASLIPADTIRAFLHAHGVTPADDAAPIEQSVVRIICVRK